MITQPFPPRCLRVTGLRWCVALKIETDMLANQIKATHEPGFMLAGKCDPCSFSKIKNNDVEQQDHLNRKSDQRVTPGSGPRLQSRSHKRLGILLTFLNMASLSAVL